MNKDEILGHCVIVEVTKCEKDYYWYANLVGKHLVAFGFDEDDEKIYCCHKDNDYNTMATLPLENGRIINGELHDLYDMS